MLTKATCSIAGAEQEAHRRPEGIRRRQTDEIEARDRGLEFSGQDRRKVDRPQLAVELLAQERQPAQIDPVAGSGDDMIGR